MDDPREPLPFTVTKGQLKALYEAIEGTDFMQVRLTSVEVRRKRGILASYTIDGGRVGDDTRAEVLVIGNGVVRL